MKKEIFEKIITEKRAKSSNERPKYGLRKLTVGVVSCLLGYMMFFTPNVTLAEKVEAKVESTEVAKTENGKKASEQPKDEAVETTEAAESKEAEQPVSHVQAYSSRATKTNAQDRTVRTTAEETSETATEGKTEQAKQSDSYVPELEAIKVVKGQSVEDYRKAFKNLPEDATIKVETPADTTTDGEKIATIEITFADQSTKKEIITVIVFGTQEDLDKSESEEQGISEKLGISEEFDNQPVTASKAEEALPENRNPKTNWDEKADERDERNWAVDIAGGQRLVRVRTTEPTQITDINYDGTYTNADGRDTIKLLYKEKTQSVSAVWSRMVLKFDSALFNQIDWDASYGEKTDATHFKFVDGKGKNEKYLDLYSMTSPKGQSRRNLPIHLVLKKGTTIKALGEENFSVQMRLMDDKFERIYAMAPKGSSMDYTTYTKSTTIPLANDIDMAFYKGGKAQSLPYALQNGFFSSFEANPTEKKELSYIYKNYKDEEDLASLAVLSTQYQAQRSVGDPKDEQEGKPAAYVQIFDASFVDYLKPDKNGNIAYTNVLNWSRQKAGNKVVNVGIKKEQINYKYDKNGNKKFAYVVLASSKYQNKNTEQVVRVDNDNFWAKLNYSEGYITTVDYMVDKSKFANTFKSSGKNKVDFPIMSGWVDSNPNGWAVYERTFDKDMVLPKGYKSPIIDTGVDINNDGVLFQVGDPNDALVRRPQGYYNGRAAGTGGLDQITKEGITGQYTYILREGATIKKGDKVRVLLQDYGKENVSVNFYNLETGTERDQSKPVLSLGEEGLGKNKRRVLTTHIYKDFKNDRGYYKVRYTPVGKTEEKTFEFKIVDTLVGVKWEATDKKMITGTPNYAVTATEGNFKIDLGKVEPGTDLIIESYNSKGELQEGETASMTFDKFKRVDNYTDLSWLDLMDNMSLLTLKKSLYRPYQEMYTNDYAMSEEGLKDNQKINQIYRDPRSLPTSEDAFKHDTESVQGFTRYDGGTLRLLYVDKNGKRYIAKANADENDYDKDGNITKDATKKVKVNGKDYDAFPYEVYLKQFDPTRNAPVSGETFKLYKDMRFFANTSDGSSVASDWLENRVRARVLFNATEGTFEGNKKQDVRIVPDNVKFYDQDGYAANGFTGEGANTETGDKFVANPTAEGKTFLGWVTEAGKTELGNTITTAEAFNKLSADKKFTAETPVERHLVVYAVWSNEQLVKFDANGGKFEDQAPTKDIKTNEDKTVTAPTAPTREGYKFLGWASKSDATEAEAGILENISEAKTVYAVWEEAKTEKTADKVQPSYKEAGAQVGQPTTITAPNFTDKDGQPASKPEDAKFALGEGAPAGATINPDTGEIQYKPAADKAGQDVDIPVVVTYTDDSTDNVKVTVKVADKTTTPEDKPAITDGKAENDPAKDTT
ncbi:Rib/alpha-like domain-containing protein, partial [Finegoldia magna]|uniref:Rib/alpha-like domain-containing protein n=1 Tax=Finegoldia magna TaxID=1260 RepID=UPI002910F854